MDMSKELFAVKMMAAICRSNGFNDLEHAGNHYRCYLELADCVVHKTAACELVCFACETFEKKPCDSQDVRHLLDKFGMLGNICKGLGIETKIERDK